MAVEWNPDEAIEAKRVSERSAHALMVGVERFQHASVELEISMDVAALAMRRWAEAWEEGEQAERYRTAKTYGLI